MSTHLIGYINLEIGRLHFVTWRSPTEFFFDFPPGYDWSDCTSKLIAKMSLT